MELGDPKIPEGVDPVTGEMQELPGMPAPEQLPLFDGQEVHINEYKLKASSLRLRDEDGRLDEALVLGSEIEVRGTARVVGVSHKRKEGFLVREHTVMITFVEVDR